MNGIENGNILSYRLVIFACLSCVTTAFFARDFENLRTLQQFNFDRFNVNKSKFMGVIYASELRISVAKTTEILEEIDTAERRIAYDIHEYSRLLKTLR